MKKLHYDGNEYLIKIESGRWKVSEITEMPGTKYKGLAKVNPYDADLIFFELVGDIANLAGKCVDDVMDFLGVEEND